jgi:hypothetical protein
MREIVILKLDFIKAFDTIEHTCILQMMKQLGFNDQWLQWTTAILQTASTSILLNGVPGKSLPCKRGVGREILCLPSYLFWLQRCCNASSTKPASKDSFRCQSPPQAVMAFL